jgi:hypothetical protein
MNRLSICVLLASFLVSACASERNVQRSFARSDLSEVPLKTVEVFVFVAGPPRESGDTLDVKSFDPPEEDLPLAVGNAEPATQRALTAAVRSALEAAGHRVIFAGGQTPAIQTSSTATITDDGPGAARVEQAPLPPSMTLRELREKSTADAILVVRAVPVDRFIIDFGAGSRIEITALGRERVIEVKPVPHQGRLMVGQTFLFDRKTGVRLWTKQIPDFPDGGHLTDGHPFLSYGFVAGPTETVTPPSQDDRAQPAARAFVSKMLADFPKAQEGTSEMRARLDDTDVAVEQEVQSFFDEGHLMFDVAARFQHGPTTMGLELQSQALPELTTGALSPNGSFGVVPRAGYLTAGGWAFSLAAPLAFIPNSFSRSYHRDANEGDQFLGDANAKVNVSGGMSFGLDATVGPTFLLSPTMILVPNAGAFFEVLSFDATPSSVVRNASRTRLGLVGSTDLWIRPSPSSTFFGRAGFGLRLGVDTTGDLAFGALFTAGAGIFL